MKGELVMELFPSLRRPGACHRTHDQPTKPTGAAVHTLVTKREHWPDILCPMRPDTISNMRDINVASPPSPSPEPVQAVAPTGDAAHLDTAPIESTEPDRDMLVDAVEAAGSHAWVGRGLTAPLRKLWLDVSFTGLENVPTDGPVVLAANHLAFIDSLLVMYCLDRPVSFLGKAEYLNNPIARRLFPMTGMLPLDRTGRRARVTLKRVQQILSAGGVVGVHPEGTRSRDGLLNPGHSGVAQMALRANAPVVPVALIGTADAQPVGQIIPTFRSPIEVRFGAPIGMGRWARNRRTRTAREELTEEVMAELAALSGQQRRAQVPEPILA